MNPFNSDEMYNIVKEMYKHFYSINVNKFLDKKGKLDYLQWAVCWAIVKAYDATAKFWFDDFNGRGVRRYMDGDGNYTAEIKSYIMVCGVTFEMHLPCMDYRNQAIINPTSRDINDCKMRAMVKNCSINLGIGAYVYEGLKAPRKNAIIPSLEVGTHSDSNDDALFTPKNTTPIEGVSHNFNPNVTVSVDAVSPNDEGNGSVVDSVVLIGYGAMEMTYGEVYQKNIKSVDSQIAWCKANGKGKKAEEHLANLIQYRMFISSADHAGSTIG